MQKFLFICGCARSGTSALVQFLNQNPAMFVGMERYISLLLRSGTLPKDLFTKERFFDVRDGDTHYKSFDRFPFYRDGQERFEQAEYIGDKIPRIYDYYRPIAANFPDAKFIYIVRNIFDVAASFKRRANDQTDVHWGRKRDAISAISEWNRSLRATQEFRGTGKVYIIHFEEFFLQGIGIEPLAEFLGIDMSKLAVSLANAIARAEKKPASTKDDILTSIEKSEILRSADFGTYRRLLNSPNPEPSPDPGPKPDPAAKPGGAPAQPRPKAPTVFRKYEAEDAGIVDYGYTTLEGCSFAIRGAVERGDNGRNIACLGSAATFGRYIEQPYPQRIGEMLHANVTNLGFGGARFETYLKEPATLAFCKASDLVVLELMSARSYRCDLFQPRSHLGGLGAIGRRYADMISAKTPQSPLLQDRLFVDRAYEWGTKNLKWDELLAIRTQLLDVYRSDAIRLIQEIGRPVVLLWISQRSMNAKPQEGSLDSYSCGFPHFVDRETVQALRPHVVGLVEVVSKRGIPSTTPYPADEKNNQAGKPMKPFVNSYYPSPEMHREAAQKLAKSIAGFWGETVLEHDNASNAQDRTPTESGKILLKRLRQALDRYRPTGRN